MELDVTADGPTIEKSVQKAWDVFGHIHALVNNADFVVRGNMFDLTLSCWMPNCLFFFFLIVESYC